MTNPIEVTLGDEQPLIVELITSASELTVELSQDSNPISVSIGDDASQIIVELGEQNPITVELLQMGSGGGDVSGLVPYTGADKNVNLGNNDLTSDSEVIARHIAARGEQITLKGFDTYDLVSNIAAHWTFDGTLLDSFNNIELLESDDAYFGYTRDGASRNKAFVNGSGNTCLYTSDSRVKQITQPFSISGWFTAKDVAMYYGQSTGSDGYSLRFLAGQSPSSFYFFYPTTTGFNFSPIHPTTVYVDDDKLHIIVTVNTNVKTIKIYTNGQLSNTLNYTGDLINNLDHRFTVNGRFTDNSTTSSISGSAIGTIIDELTYFTKEITAQEAEYIFNNNVPLEPLETDGTPLIKLEAKRFDDGQFITVDDNTLVPIDDVAYKQDTKQLVIPGLLVKNDSLETPQILFEGRGDDLSWLLDMKYSNLFFMNASDFPPLLDDFGFPLRDRLSFGRGNKIVLAQNFAVGSFNDLSSQGIGESGSRIAVGSFNNIRTGNSAIVGRQNNTYRQENPSSVTVGQNVIGYGNRLSLTGGSLFGIGFNSQIGNNSINGGKTGSGVIGFRGHTNSNYSMLFSLTNNVSGSTIQNILSVDESFLFAIHDGTQRNLLHIHNGKGVRIGATSGETQTMTGKDLYVDGHVESKSKIWCQNDIELTTAETGVILKSPNGTRYKLTVDNDGNLETTAL